jgi:hypothetical protein
LGIEEHIFMDNDDILISSTRLVMDNKVIATSAICSFELDKEEVKPPYVIFSLAFLAFFTAIFSPYYNEIGSFACVVLVTIGLAIWGSRKSNRKEAIILDLASGEREYIDSNDVDNLDEIFNTLNEIIIFRG